MSFKKILIIFLLLLLPLSFQLTSLAVSVNGNLTSTFWVRENRLEGAENAETNLLLYEYLNLHAVNIGTPKLGAHVSGRFGFNKLESFEEKYSSRLYQGYLDWKLSNKSSLRLGRHFLPNDVGFWQIDGMRLETHRSGFISPSFYMGVSVPFWTIDGNREALLGLELNTRRVRGILGKISFLTVLDSEGDGLDIFKVQGVDKAIIGFQIDRFTEGIMELLESPHSRFNVMARGSVDVLSKQIVSSYIFTNTRIITDLYASLGYQHETPLFPADSIFSVFDLEPFRELNAGVDYLVLNFLKLQGQYARQFFESEPINKYSAGFILISQLEPILSIRLERLSNIDSHYWRVYSHIGKRFGERLEVGFNNYYNNYKLSSSINTEDAYSFQLKASYKLSRNLQALLRLEDNINPDYEYNIRALGYLRMGFGFTK